MSKRPHRSLAAAAIIVLALTGCDASGTSPDGGTDVQTMTETEATGRVRDLADQLRTATSAAALANERAGSAPCDTDTGDDSEQVRYVQGTYLLPLPAAQHVAAYEKVRAQWQGQGWTISDYRVPADGDGTMSARAPGRGLSFTLVTAQTPDTLGLIVQSGCYRDAASG